MRIPLRWHFNLMLFHLFLMFAVGLVICLTPQSAESARPIKIAAIYALSGSAAEANATSMRGIRLALEEINAGGGILGRRLELLPFDNQSSPLGSKVAAEEAVAKHVTAIIGAAFSTHSIAIARVAQEKHIPMISNASTSTALTGIGDYIFRVCFNDHIQGRIMAEFARRELKAGSAAILIDVTSDYSLGLSARFESAFTRSGGTIAAKIPYTTHQPNFRDIAARAAAVETDVLFVPGHDESARIINEVVRSGFRPNVIFLGGDGWDEENFYNQGGREIQLAYFTTHWSPAIKSKATEHFMARHGRSSSPVASTALAYDAVMLLADALKRAGSTDSAALRDALASTHDFKGVTGTISFNASRDPAKKVVMMKIENGRPVYVKQLDTWRGNSP